MKRRTVQRGVRIDHEPPIIPHGAPKPPPPGDRVIKGRDGRRWFICGASGRVTEIKAKSP